MYYLEIYKGDDISEASLFRKIKGSVCNCHGWCSVISGGACGAQLEIDVVDKFGYLKGKIKKTHNGCLTECCTTSDKYEMTLPQDEEEAVLMLAALQYVDMAYFEEPYMLLNP